MRCKISVALVIVLLPVVCCGGMLLGAVLCKPDQTFFEQFETLEAVESFIQVYIYE